MLGGGAPGLGIGSGMAAAQHEPEFTVEVQVMPDLTFTTANIAGDLSRTQRRGAYDIALRGSTFLGTQEMQRQDADSFVDRRTTGTIQYGRHGARARCALHYQRDRVERLAWGNPLLHLSNLFLSGNRFYCWGRFRDLKTGRIWTVAVIHFGPHYDDARGGISDKPRGRLATKSITALVGLARRTSSNLVVMGDFNIDARKDMTHYNSTDLMERFKRVGLASASKHFGKALPTHGRHASYDQVFARLVTGSRMKAQYTRRNGPGDHLAFSLEVASTVRSGWTPR